MGYIDGIIDMLYPYLLSPLEEFLINDMVNHN